MSKSTTEAILAERGATYGSYSQQSAITQNIQHAFRNSPNWVKLRHYQADALQMIAAKIGRILNGDPDYLDSWEDIAGYATLVVKELKEIK